MYFSKSTLEVAEALVHAAWAKGLTIATAESCTGGLIAAAITEVPGASDVFMRGFVTYANEAKTDLLGVPEALLAQFGAVSEEVARAMAEGALGAADADIAVSATGVAGPGGGSEAKPVGLVYMAASVRGGATLHERAVFSGDRQAVRAQAVETALALLRQQAETAPARG
ncbi:MAG TPA: nicotinamide-nucleotide amidohydrolase family protein [Alphaproteobacteria bacterium]|nr:nicotinamide-nucleotide amidohydrolase family protein [Alphaproteobacteria bacterium]